MKWIGLLLVILAGAGWGMGASRELRRRVRMLTQCERLLFRMTGRLRYASPPVRELLAACVDEGAYGELPFLADTLGRLKGETRFAQAWGAAVDGTRGFTAEERALLRAFGEGLGRSDVAGQVAHCESYRALLEERLAEARRELATKGRLYATLGFAGGAALGILLL